MRMNETRTQTPMDFKALRPVKFVGPLLPQKNDRNETKDFYIQQNFEKYKNYTSIGQKRTIPMPLTLGDKLNINTYTGANVYPTIDDIRTNKGKAIQPVSLDKIVTRHHKEEKLYDRKNYGRETIKYDRFLRDTRSEMRVNFSKD